MKIWLFTFFALLPNFALATPVCVSCYEPVDGPLIERLLGLKVDVPERVDVLAQLRTFAKKSPADRDHESELELAAAAGYVITPSRQARVLAKYSRLVVEHIAVDLEHFAPYQHGHELPFVASVAWTRADTNRAGETWVHGRLRITGVDIGDHGGGVEDLNARIASAIKIDVLVGDYALAASERDRRDLVREVLVPAVIAQGFVPLVEQWAKELVESLHRSMPTTVPNPFAERP